MLGKKSSVILSIFGSMLISPAIYAHPPHGKQAVVPIIPVANAVVNDCYRVFIPAFQPGFEFSVAALALKPGATNLNYVIYNNELPAQSPTWTERELRPDYDWGFELGARYVFLEGKDANLTWTHLNSTTNATTIAPSASFFLGPDYEIGPTGTVIRKATGKAEFRYDVINLDFGQMVDFGRSVRMRFFAGLSNAYLREIITTNYSGTTPGPIGGPFNTNQEIKGYFTGLGPRFGIAANYVTDYGFGFLGEAAASALIGDSYAKTTFTSSSAELLALYGQTINNQFIKDQNVTQVIPAFDAKLGIFYRYAFNPCALFTVKAGYQAAVYVNAINEYLPGSLVSFAPLERGGIFVATMNHRQTNYSVQGPFLEASFAMA